MARPRMLANPDLATETRPVTLEDAVRAELSARGLDFVTLNRRGRHAVDLALKSGNAYRILTLRAPQELASMLEIDDRLFDEIVAALNGLTARAG